MVRDIIESNFPSYATISEADVSINDMGEKDVTATVEIDGGIVPDFSYDWEIVFKGERYIMPYRKPQGEKNNTSKTSKFSLTFSHWCIYELKRYYFVEMTSVESGTAIADKFNASLSLSISDFKTALNKVLYYYFGDKINCELYEEISDTTPATISISYTYIWDLLLKIYDIYGLRWCISRNEDDTYTIRIGFPQEELSHIFEYGFNGGLMKLERQVQSYEIKNIMYGRGGEKNIPYRYFKASDPDNPSFIEDPDWIPELSSIYFSELRDSAFRSYVQGWKAKRYGGHVTKSQASVGWAWEMGYNDEKFQPVEYVKDDKSISEYGELPGAAENNEDIYPTIQGVSIEPYGRIDEVVEVEKLKEEDVDEDSGATSIYIAGIPRTDITGIESKGSKEFVYDGESFEVDFGKKSNIIPYPTFYSAKKSGTDRTSATELVSIEESIVAVNESGEVFPASGLTEGKYRYRVTITITNSADYSVDVKLYSEKDYEIQSSYANEQSSNGIFHIWVKNIWGSSKNEGESNEDYADRVWRPILGDFKKNTPKIVFSDGWLSISEDYEFEILPMPVYDDSKSFNGVQSHWKLTLSRSDAEYDATGKMIPNSMTNAEAGNHFFIIGIDIPYTYYVEAEKRLTKYKEEVLSKVSDISPTWVVSLDRIRLSQKLPGENSTLFDEIKIGSIVRIADNRFINGGSEALYVQSITYKYRKATSEDNALNPDMEIVLSDKISTTGNNAISELQGEVNTLRSQIISSNIDIVKKYDKRTLSDTNVMSSVRTLSEISSKAISRVYNDSAKGIITFLNGARFGNNENARILNNGIAEFASATIRNLMSSTDFVNGFTGKGWRLAIENGLSKLELDELTVRKVMHVLELIIEKIRAIGGQLVISAANGVIREVGESRKTYYRIYLEGENQFVEHDLIRCQTFTGSDIRGYWVEVHASDTSTNSILVNKTEFDEGIEPKEGDEIVLLGNTSDTKRQNAISISATEDGQPRIDILNGIREKNLDGCLRSRFGNLDGIVDSWFPIDNQPHGDGLYADNAYLTGTFLLDTGEDVKTKFSVEEGKVESAITSIREDFVDTNGFLANPNFNRGLESWTIDSSALLYATGQTCIISNSELLSSKLTGTAISKDEERVVVRISDSYIMQKNADMRSRPEIVTDADGMGYAALVHLSVLVKVISAGTLDVGFVGESTAGFHDFMPFAQQASLVPSNGYAQLTFTGYWSGTGDFKFSFSGEMYAYMFVLTSDPVEAFTYRYKTLFEQSARLTKLSTAIYDKDDNLLQETGLVVKPEGSGIYMQTADGKVALIGVGVEETLPDGTTKTVVKLTADNIRLEGLVTANDHFKVNEDGTVETENAKIHGTLFGGTIEGANGYFSGFLYKSPTIINKENIQEYYDVFEYEGIEFYWLSLKKSGSYIVLEGDPPDGGWPDVMLPYITPLASMGNGMDLSARECIGNTLIVYNKSESGFGITGRIREQEEDTPLSFGLNPGCFALLECKLTVSNTGYEDIWWKISIGKFAQ